MESTRQKKIARQLQKDLSEIFQLEGRTLFATSFVSVTVVRVSPDLSVARVYVSVFGVEDKQSLLQTINQQGYAVRKKLAVRVPLLHYLDSKMQTKRRILKIENSKCY